MVYVKLLKDVAEGGVEWRADAPRNAAGQRPPLKVTRSHGRTVEYLKDTIVTMHEHSAAKWIERGLCVLVEPVTEKGETEAKAKANDEEV